MSAPLDVVLLPHTHWDREWYQPAGVFRQRLVALVDELLASPERSDDAPDGVGRGSFLLDGQAVVLDDYLAVRPDRRDRLATALVTGALEAGPWYVLADELIPGGEALVRNLLAGRRALAALGASAPPVLYSPDAFGHTAALPVLADGFGCRVAIVWRGYGGERWPAGDSAWWTAPNGARVLLHHLPPDGYEYGSSLPAAPDAAERWSRMRDVLAPRARLGLVLVQNGADHHARQPDWRAAFDALAAAASPDRVTWGSLGGFAATLASRAESAALPTVCGELRDSYGYTWTLQGTFAARAAQKRRNAAVERALLRDVEPWLALRALRDGDDASTRALLHACWRTLLLNHPHDTLCGCSTDEVARAADARFDDAGSQAASLGAAARAALLGQDPDAARVRRDRWRPALVIRNRAARRRGGVAEVELLTFVRDVAVGPGSAGTWRPACALGATPTVYGGRVPVQVLARALRHDRIEAPRHYPDDDLVEAATAVVWVPPLDGFALATYALDGAAAGVDGAGPSRPVVARDTTLDNGRVSAGVDARGTIAMRDAAAGVSVASLIGFEDVGDAGDLYTHSTLGVPLTTAWCAGTRLVHRGPLRGEVEARYRLRVPTAARGDDVDPLSRPTHRARGHVELPIELRLVLDADADFVRVHVRGDNLARDHRLRLVIRTGVPGGRVFADAAFGPVAREPIVVAATDAIAEQPPATAPLHRWVSITNDHVAATIFADGLAEYEATPTGDVSITLVRAVGELSRPDLPERPGNAGWPVPTPEAQSLGPFEASFGVAFHAPHGVAGSPESLATLDRIERLADEILLPLVGDTLRSALGALAPAGGLTLDGAGLAFSAAMPADDGAGVVLRCVNVTGATVAGAWRIGMPIAEARLARLDETRSEGLGVEHTDDGASVIRIVVPPRGVHTVIARSPLRAVPRQPIP